MIFKDNRNGKFKRQEEILKFRKDKQRKRMFVHMDLIKYIKAQSPGGKYQHCSFLPIWG
jgi:glycerol-3-phosphate responsive antiterminator